MDSTNNPLRHNPPSGSSATSQDDRTGHFNRTDSELGTRQPARLEEDAANYNRQSDYHYPKANNADIPQRTHSPNPSSPRKRE
jgi:hypothetical protein